MARKTSSAVIEQERNLAALVSQLKMALSRHQYGSFEQICKNIIRTAKILERAGYNLPSK